MTGEPIFFAEITRQAENVERVLDEAGIIYTMRLEAMPREGAACYQGILYEVSADDAAKCRRLIVDKGLSPFRTG